MFLLVENLPKKDRELANKFLESRDFNSLLELVQSDIKKYFRNKKKEQPEEELLNLEIDMLRLFENKILFYARDLLDIEEFEEN